MTRQNNRFTVKVTGSVTLTAKHVVILLMLVGLGLATLYQR